MTVFDLHNFAQVSAGRVLNTMAEGVAIAALTWVVVRLFGIRNSAIRFALFFSTQLAVVALPFFVPPTSFSTSAPWQRPEVTAPSSWAIGLFVAWAVIAFLLLARLCVSLWHVGRLRRDSQEADLTILDKSLVNVLQAFGSRRRIKLRFSDCIRVPAALGFFHPSIVIPRWAVRELPPEELKGILLHELAHLHRWDDWTNLAQKVLKALFFFHPAVWWIESRLALEREMACDDMVLAHTANPKTYAESLVSLAERIHCASVLALAQAALGRMKHTSLRIAQILDGTTSRTTPGWAPVIGAVAAISTAAFLALPYAPQLIAFQDKMQPVLSATAAAGSLPDRQVAKASTSGSVALNSRAVAFSARAKMTGRTQPKVMMAKAVATRIAPGAQVVVVVQSTACKGCGSTVWTLCIWRITPRNPADQEPQTTIIMNSI
jgi:beta-lactamase regulating signal transducer with metallopeptidase domain